MIDIFTIDLGRMMFNVVQYYYLITLSESKWYLLTFEQKLLSKHYLQYINIYVHSFEIKVDKGKCSLKCLCYVADCIESNQSVLSVNCHGSEMYISLLNDSKSRSLQNKSANQDVVDIFELIDGIDILP